MRKIDFSNPFKKALKKVILKRPDAVFALIQKLFLLSQDINHPSLKLHKLKGELNNYHAISVEYDLRIIFEITEDKIILINVGPHDDVY